MIRPPEAGKHINLSLEFSVKSDKCERARLCIARVSLSSCALACIREHVCLALAYVHVHEYLSLSPSYSCFVPPLAPPHHVVRRDGTGWTIKN